MEILATNDADIVRRMSDLSRGIQERVLKPVVEEAGKMVAAAAAGKVRVRTGLLEASIGVSGVKTYKHGYNAVTVYIAAGPRRGFRRVLARGKNGRLHFAGKQVAKGTPDAANPVLYAHLVEKGHGGPHPAPAYPFMGPTEGSVAAAVEDMARDKIAARIAAEIAKTV